MKQVIRRGVFETNSSSTHTVTILGRDSGERKITDDFEKLIIVLEHLWNKMVANNRYLSYSLEELNVKDREDEEKLKMFFSLDVITKNDLINIYGDITGNLDSVMERANHILESHRYLASLKELAIDTYLKKTNSKREDVLKRIDDYFASNKLCPLCNKKHKRNMFKGEVCPNYDVLFEEKIIEDTFNNKIEYYSSTKGHHNYKIVYSNESRREICYYEHKLEILISSCQLKIRDHTNYLRDSLRVCDFSFDAYYISDDLLKKIILKEKVTLSELEEIIGEKVNTTNGEITLDEYEYQIIPDINFEIEEINEYRKRINNYLEAYCEYVKGDLNKILEYHKDDWFINRYEDPMCSSLFSEGPLNDDMCDYCPIYYELDDIRKSYNSDKEFALAFLNGELKTFIGER